MQRDHQQLGLNSRDHDRQEWAHQQDHDHPAQARERPARRSGKTHKTHGIRTLEAERQIRELRARY